MRISRRGHVFNKCRMVFHIRAFTLYSAIFEIISLPVARIRRQFVDFCKCLSLPETGMLAGTKHRIEYRRIRVYKDPREGRQSEKLSSTTNLHVIDSLVSVQPEQ